MRRFASLLHNSNYVSARNPESSWIIRNRSCSYPGDCCIDFWVSSSGTKRNRSYRIRIPRRNPVAQPRTPWKRYSDRCTLISLFGWFFSREKNWNRRGTHIFRGKNHRSIRSISSSSAIRIRDSPHPLAPSYSRIRPWSRGRFRTHVAVWIRLTKTVRAQYRTIILICMSMGASETQSILANPNTVNYPHCLPSYRQSEKYRTILLGILEWIFLGEKILWVRWPALYFSGTTAVNWIIHAHYGGIPIEFPSDLTSDSQTLISIDNIPISVPLSQTQRDKVIFRANWVFWLHAKKITISHLRG